MISRASPPDLEQIAPLFHAYRAFFAGAADLNESRRFLQERLAQDDSVIFLARDRGEAVGFIQLYPLWSSWYCGRIWFLSDLYVAAPARKRGVGKRLVERAIEHAKETAAVSMIVELPRREPHLTSFYRELGFEPDGVFDLARWHGVA